MRALGDQAPPPPQELTLLRRTELNDTEKKWGVAPAWSYAYTLDNEYALESYRTSCP